jgi:hypothetical protein
MSTYWNVEQACVWIDTRDERLVAGVRTNDTLIVTERLATDPAAFESRHPLVEACKNGNVVMLARHQGKGEPIAIPQTAWMHLELRYDEKRGVTAAPPNASGAKARWWNGLRILARDIQRTWPFPRKRRLAERYGYDLDSRPDSIAEQMWTMRRWRQVQHVKSTPLTLTADGLPEEVEVSLVEAWSWCAFGVAVPKSVWIDENVVRRADRAYATERLLLAEALRWTRRAWAAMEANIDPSSNQSARIEYRAAIQSEQYTRHAVRKAFQEFEAVAALWKRIQDVYGSASRRLGAESIDIELLRLASDKAERDLFNAFLADELECLGRHGDEAMEWSVLPKSCFRLPVEIRCNHNVLEPHSTRASVQEHKLVMEGAARWRDLRVKVSALRSWWNLKNPSELTNVPQDNRELQRVPIAQGRGGNTAIDDAAHLKRFAEAKKTAPDLSVRAFVLANDKEIRGTDIDAKIRRLQGKVKASSQAS